MGLTLKATVVLQVTCELPVGSLLSVTCCHHHPLGLAVIPGLCHVTKVYPWTGSTAGRAHLQLPSLSQLGAVEAVQAHRLRNEGESG